MSDTIAMPQSLLDRCSLGGTANPLCPSCPTGRLHPYYVSFSTSVVPGSGWYGADYLNGFVAVCQGIRDSPHCADAEPCGFSMPLTPGTTGRMNRAT